MFNSSEIKTRTGVKPGINSNVGVEMVYAPIGEGNTPVLQFRIADTTFKKVFWEPKKGGISYERTAKYPFEFMGFTVPKGKIMNDDENFAFDCMDLTQNLKNILKAVGVEADFKAPDYAGLATEVVKLFGGVKKADVKLTYDSKGYLSFPKFGYVAEANSGTLTINPQYDKLTNGTPATDVTSTGASDSSQDLPF